MYLQLLGKVAARHPRDTMWGTVITLSSLQVAQVVG
jgi:hypothetical protein